MTLAIEGAATTQWSTGATSGTINITTSGTDRIIILVVASEKTGTVQSTNLPTASGLTFALRKTLPFTDSGGGDQVLSVYWAYAAAQQTAKTITINLGATPDDVSVGVFAVSGVTNFTNPWDTNSSLPATATGNSGPPATVSGVSTTQANSMIFGFYGTRNGPTNPGADTGNGYASVLSLVNTGGSAYSGVFVESKLCSSAQSSLTVATANSGSSSHYTWIVDAITADGSSPSGTIAQTLGTITQSLTGTDKIIGTIAQTLGKISQAVTGTDTYPNAPGEWHSTEAADVFAAAGYQPIVAAFALTEAADTFSAYIKLTDKAAWSSTEAKDIFVGTAYTTGEGAAWTSTEPVDVFSAIGYTPSVGTFVTTENKDRFAALGIGATASAPRRVFFVC